MAANDSRMMIIKPYVKKHVILSSLTQYAAFSRQIKGLRSKSIAFIAVFCLLRAAGTQPLWTEKNNFPKSATPATSRASNALSSAI